MESPVGATLFILAVFMCFAYFIPALIAWARAHHLFWTILVLNFFLGWSVIGWVVALAMAVGPVRRADTEG